MKNKLDHTKIKLEKLSLHNAVKSKRLIKFIVIPTAATAIILVLASTVFFQPHIPTFEEQWGNPTLTATAKYGTCSS